MSKTRETILNSAIKVFSTKGYDGATMDDVAIVGGVAKGTLYYHFKSKEELFKYVIDEGIKNMEEKSSSVLSLEQEPIDKIRALIKIQLEIVHEYKDFFRVALSELWGNEERQKDLRNTIKQHIEYLSNHIKKAIEAGVIEKNDSEFLTYTFFGGLCTLAIYDIINEDKYDVNELTEKLIAYISKGISLSK
ncbi:TetR/AcrR family transcriptional regulator [Clostridium sp. Marseille-Q7071]